MNTATAIAEPAGRERSLILYPHEVRAALEGRLGQVRRMVRPQPPVGFEDPWMDAAGRWVTTENRPPHILKNYTLRACPFGAPGDRLWVKEMWCQAWDYERDGWFDPPRAYYRADGADVRHVDGWHTASGRERSPWRSSATMPRWASRVTLELTAVRVERLQRLSEEDARASGILDGGCLTCGESSHPNPCGCEDPKPSFIDSFIYEWSHTCGKRSPWASNPWTWVGEVRPL